MLIDLASIPGSFQLPRPDWEVIGYWIERKIPQSESRQAWTDAATQWLEILNRAMGGFYEVHCGEELVLFAPKGYEQWQVLFQYGALVLDSLGNLLGGIASANWRGPLVILLFGHSEEYYAYKSQFMPEGEWGGSAGTCFKEGYVHVALQFATIDQLQITLAHEFAHAALSHLDLPLWLEEGITQQTEEAAHSLARFELQVERAQEIKHYWQEHGLQSFWWGEGFFNADDGQRCSYELSRILFRVLVSDHRTGLADFIRHANSADAGESAARQFLGMDLACLAATFLGPGGWSPQPADVGGYLRRGAYHAERKQISAALRDFDSASQIDPNSIEVYFRRAGIHHEMGEYGREVAEYEKAMEVDPKNWQIRNNMAWLLATCPQDNFRDGARAVELATKACEESGYDVWYCLGTLAAAHAEAGDFEEARVWAKDSLRRAPENERNACRRRLRLYKMEQPHREELATKSNGKNKESGMASD